ncbi:hypothetical protein Bca52824_002772 [Brassica carinata]|uniref:Uncharacterized protein n=1 Tax=Brassica carinata TaxID=52824 RepID=A0A8X7WLH2_BRACI|nr:hypothetical protein Bca52824_002772 [Brassica carinata]
MPAHGPNSQGGRRGGGFSSGRGGGRRGGRGGGSGRREQRWWDPVWRAERLRQQQAELLGFWEARNGDELMSLDMLSFLLDAANKLYGRSDDEYDEYGVYQTDIDTSRSQANQYYGPMEYEETSIGDGPLFIVAVTMILV